jgi:selenocysteine lyase/cysteine desulfurase
MLDRLGIPGLKVHGITARDKLHKRVPTFSVISGPSLGLARRLGRERLRLGRDFYAKEVVDRLGLADKEGFLRMGLCHYNTKLRSTGFAMC